MVSSGLPLVYIAHRIDADGRQAYGARLRGLAECVVAADLAPPDRQQRLAQAEVLATFSPAHELGESELQFTQEFGGFLNLQFANYIMRDISYLEFV